MTQKCGYCSLRFLVSLRLVPIVSWNLPGGVLNWGEGALVVFQSWSFFWYSVVLETIWISENSGGTWPHTASQKRKRKNIWEYIIVPNPVIIYWWPHIQHPWKKNMPGVYYCTKPSQHIRMTSVEKVWWYVYQNVDNWANSMQGRRGYSHHVNSTACGLLQVFQMSRLSCVARPILPGSAESGTPRQTLTVA